MKNSNIEYLYNHYKYIDSYISVLELMKEDKREVIKKWVNIKAIIYCEYSNMDIIDKRYLTYCISQRTSTIEMI